MTTYNTGAPIGSTNVKDLYDNAQNLDHLVNDRTTRSYKDRLGVDRKSWWGMEQDFQDFLLNSGYQSLGDYAAGITLTTRNQFVWKDGELYRIADSVSVPYTTTGDWATESGKFVAIGDRVLRQNLADKTPGSGADMVGFAPADTGAVATTVADRLNTLITPNLFGAVGDGAVDDSLFLQAYVDAVGPYGTVNLIGGTFAAHAIKLLPGQTILGGKIVTNRPDDDFCFAFVPADDCSFVGVTAAGTGVVGTTSTPKYQGFVCSGNTSWPAPYNITPANRVTIAHCSLSKFTSVIFVGGSSVDPVPDGWRVSGNAIFDVVGFPGQSEGYGILFSPAQHSIAQGNTIKNIQRHAVYLAGGAQGCIVDSNVISATDNIAIQSNTYSNQPYTSDCVISNNVISNVTKSQDYGYKSSICIGVYGKHTRTKILGNNCSAFIDLGIQVSGTSEDATRTGTSATVEDNSVDCSSAVISGGISAADIDAIIKGNRITCSSGAYGIISEGATDAASTPTVFSGNVMYSYSGTAVAFRAAWPGHIVKISGNELWGFAGADHIILDTTNKAYIDTFRDVSYYNSDANFTHRPSGSDSVKDARSVRWAGALSANRDVTLQRDGDALPGAEFTLIRPSGSGAQTITVYDGTTSSPIKTITQGQWVTCVLNRGPAWEIKAFGSL